MRKFVYVVEDADWVIREEGLATAKYLKSLFGIEVEVRTSAYGIRDSLIHFGSRSTLLPNEYHSLDPSNRVVLTWYHGTDQDQELIASLLRALPRIEVVHTTNLRSKADLIRWGVPAAKITVCPLGLEYSHYQASEGPKSERIAREMQRAQFGIPKNRLVIGSFQKDGNFWGYGETPKLIKGPDILCDVLVTLSKQFPIFMLLTGPARGYVKERLRDAGVGFLHTHLDSPAEVAPLYRLLDLYLITARAEGGPKALLEAGASGIPVVSTPVGMAPEVISDGVTGYLVEGVSEILRRATDLLNAPDTRTSMGEAAQARTRDYDYSNVVRQFYQQVYQPLLLDTSSHPGALA